MPTNGFQYPMSLLDRISTPVQQPIMDGVSGPTPGGSGTFQQMPYTPGTWQPQSPLQPGQNPGNMQFSEGMYQPSTSASNMLNDTLNRTNQILGRQPQQAYTPPVVAQAPAAPKNPYNLPGNLNENQSQLLTAILNQAKQTFPDNPTMQKSAVTIAARNAGIFGEGGGDSGQLRFGSLMGGGRFNPSMRIRDEEATGPAINYRTGEYMPNGGENAMNIANQFSGFQRMLDNQGGPHLRGTPSTIYGAEDPTQVFQRLGMTKGPPRGKMDDFYTNNIAPIYG